MKNVFALILALLDRAWMTIVLVGVIAWAVWTILVSPAVGQVRFNQLPVATSLGGTEAIPLVQGGVTSYTTPAALLAYIQGQVISGTPTTGDCAKWISSTLLGDAGSACGSGGGGGSPGGSSGQIEYNNAGTFGGLAVTGSGSVVEATSPTLVTPNLGVPSALTLTNATGLPLPGLVSQAANSVDANTTGSSSPPTAVALPSCSTSASALTYTTSGGASAFSCNIAINASTLGGATFAAPGAIGGTTAGAGTFSNLSLLGSAAGKTTATSANASASNYTLTVPAVNLTLAGAGCGALATTTASNPTGTTSTSAYVMMGLGSSWSLTPHCTGRVWFVINGDLTNATASDSVNVQASYGTGTAPGNAGALAGAQCGSAIQSKAQGAATPVPFSVTCLVSGLTVSAAGVPVWIDLAVEAVTAGTGQVTNLAASAIEE